MKTPDGLVYAPLSAGPVQSNQFSLERIRAGPVERVARERMKDGDVPIKDVIGPINRREPDVIQQFLRGLRLQNRASNIENAYVQEVNAFMADRGLKTLVDFDRTGAADVEAHLTDLDVGERLFLASG